MLIVLPALVMRVLYWLYGLITGKKQEDQKPAAATGEQDGKKAAGGTCPYHVVMNFLGYPVPDKKKTADGAGAAGAEKSVN